MKSLLGYHSIRAGVEEIEPHIYRGGGIALGPEYVGKGYGKQILGLLLEYCSSLGGKGFYLRHFRVEIGGLEHR